MKSRQNGWIDVMSAVVMAAAFLATVGTVDIKFDRQTLDTGPVYHNYNGGFTKP